MGNSFFKPNKLLINKECLFSDTLTTLPSTLSILFKPAFKILIVEDNELNMKLFFDILTYQKYEVEKAYDGIEAYEKIKNNNYDLMILDIQLPKMDGFTLLKKIKAENLSSPRTIITSACAMDSDKQKAKEFNINDYITKPIDINNFINIVKSYLS